MFGADNIYSLISGGKSRWKNSLHLIFKYKLLFCSRTGFLIDWDKIVNDLNNNILTVNLESDIELNSLTGLNNLDDIANKIALYQSDPKAFLQQNIIEINYKTILNTSNLDLTLLAETSSSDVRKVIYEYNNNSNEFIEDKLIVLAPNIKNFIFKNKLYTNNINCINV